MKTKSLVIAATLLGGLLSSASAFTLVAPAATATPVKFEAPAPTSIVSPTGLPPSFKGQTVEVSLTVSATGEVSHVRLVRATDRYLLKSLVSALSQWKFTPARKNGVPVSSKVVLPLQLEES